MKLEKTDRGFVYAEFRDRNGHLCSIQKSSVIATNPSEESIWLGVTNRKAEFKLLAKTAQSASGLGWQLKSLHALFPDHEILLPDRMHLTRAQVQELLPLLQHFAETGDLPESAG